MGDIKTFHGAPSLWGDAEQPSWIKAPVIPGHEFIGRDRRPRDCGADRPMLGMPLLQGGEYWMSERHDIFGFQKNVNGGMAEYMLYTKGAIVHAVPDSVPIEEAIVVEPLSCSMHAADRGRIGNDDVVVVAGAGTLEHARRLGADLTLNTRDVDAVAEVKRLTEGYGCDVFIEATGYPPMVNTGMQMIRKLGRFVEFSVFSGETTLDWSIIGDRKELDIDGAHLGP